MLNNRLNRPELWHPGFSTQTLLDSITVQHLMAVVKAGLEPMVTRCWTTFQLFEFVKRSRYPNRAVTVLYSNKAFSINYSHCSHYTFFQIVM